MRWFTRKPKRDHQYLTDTSDWRFGSLYKHNINLAIATFRQSHLFEIERDELAPRPLGEWEAKGLVHFDTDGPLIPFEMSFRDRLQDDDGLGGFIVERIQPHNDSDYPEDHKASFLRLSVYLSDREGKISAALEKAMLYAATSRKKFLHVRLLKAALDPEAAAAQILANQYTDSAPIMKVAIAAAVHLGAPPVAFAWDDL